MRKDQPGPPSLAPLRPGEERLIDTLQLHLIPSSAGRAERYGRGLTPHTVHVWWARRPHTAMRALVFASLAPRDTEPAIIDSLCSGPVPDPEALDRARSILARCSPRPPRVLDMFGGGGTIGLEAARLGAETAVVEVNELAVFINRCHLVMPRHADPDRLEPVLREAGRRILEELGHATADLFPLRRQQLGRDPRARPTIYLWTYSTACTRCGYRFFLTRRPWVSRRDGRRLVFADGGDGQRVSLERAGDDHSHTSAWVGRTARVRCPACGAEQPADVRTCRDELVAVVASRRGAGKELMLAPDHAVPRPERLADVEREVLSEMDVELPATRLPPWSGVVNPAIYGIATHADVLNPRQRLVALHLIRSLRRERVRLERDESPGTARYVIALLSGLVDQVIDWNCRLSMWIPQNEQVGRAFCGPGVAMLWDYAEIDPALRGPASLEDKLERIIRAAVRPGELHGRVEVVHGRAESLPFEESSFDAVVSDPPYYDNMSYSVLADFISCWKRLVGPSEGGIEAASPASDSPELVASVWRHGDPLAAHEAYCAGLSRALCEAAKVLRPDGVLALVYGHATIEGWEPLVRALRSSRLVVTSVQPLAIERRQRPRAMTAEASNTCFVFVARKRPGDRPPIDLDRVVARLEEIRVGPWLGSLASAGWRDRDLALACFAQGVGLLAGSDAAIPASLEILEHVAGRCCPGFALTRRHIARPIPWSSRRRG